MPCSAQGAEVDDRFLSDYECHVFFPRELRLLFLMTGFGVESVWGNYSREPFRETSRTMIITGRKRG